MTAMKKNIIFGIAGALALFSFTACNPDLLDIPQKGVIAYEDFYQTDDDAQSALTALYAEFVSIFNAQGSNNPAWNVVVNATGDELYWGGGKKNGSSSGGQEMNEFRLLSDPDYKDAQFLERDEAEAGLAVGHAQDVAVGYAPGGEEVGDAMDVSLRLDCGDYDDGNWY